MLPPRTMITFKPANIRFTYRVGGILIHQEHVLCQLASQEELGIDMKIERLLYVVENFYTDPDDSWHELGLYFLITAPAGSYLNQGLETIMRVDEAGNHLRFDWLPIAQLEEFLLYPLCFQNALQEIPEHTVHIEERHHHLDSK